MTLSYGSGRPPFIRNEEEEDLVQQLIYNNARPEADDDGNDDGEDLTAQFQIGRASCRERVYVLV